MLNNILTLIEESLPNNQIYLDTANNVYNQGNNNEMEDLITQITEMLNIAEQMDIDKEELLNSILKTEPYVNYKELEERFKGVTI